MVIRHYSWLIEIRRRVLAAVWYPLFLVFAACAIFTVRDAIISSIHGNDLGMSFLHYGMRYMLPPIVGSFVGYGLAQLLSSRRARHAVDRVVLTVPVVGPMILKYSVAVFLEMYAAMLQAGAPAVHAYRSAALATPNTEIGRRIVKWEHFIRDGETITFTLSKTGVFTREVLAMMAAAGEVSASLPIPD